MSRNKIAYLMALPGVIIILLFFYVPLSGNVLAFKDYNFRGGVFGSPWVGFKNFQFFFSSPNILRVILNTLYLNALFIVFGLIFQMGTAILINEIKIKTIKRFTQSALFIPYFLSWVVVSGLIYNLLAKDIGTINNILSILGLEKVNWYGTPEYWRIILVVSNLWKWTGYGSIIYLAGIASIDASSYEAAMIDGAGKFQQIRYITIPSLYPTAIILTLLAIGRIFYGDFGMIYSIVRDNGLLLSTTEVIDTYVFRAMRTTGDFSMTTTIGLFQSLCGFLLVLGTNNLAKKYQGTSLF